MVISRLLPAHRGLRRRARAIFLALGFSLYGFASGPARADALEDASQSLKAGQHAKALEQVNRYLSDNPKNAQGRFMKGVILTGMDKPADAITIFQKLTEDYPSLPEPYNNLAVIYAQQKQYDKAKQALETAIRTHPAYATAHENLGDIYSRLASQAYGKALQIDASNASAQTKLAMMNELVGSEKVVAGKPPVASKPAVEPPAAVAKPPASTPPATTPAIAPPTPVVLAAADTKPLPAPKAKPEEPKPDSRPAKAEPPRAGGDGQADISASVDTWLTAWSKKDVKGYLAHYARDFQPPDGQSRKDWEAERTQRVGKPGKIEVSRDKLAIKLDGDDKAQVRFRQHYKSANLSTSSGKTLLLVKREGKWLIQQEKVGG